MPSSSCTGLKVVWNSYIYRWSVLVMDAHDTHAVGAFVLDEQRERVEQSQHQFYMT